MPSAALDASRVIRVWQGGPQFQSGNLVRIKPVRRHQVSAMSPNMANIQRFYVYSCHGANNSFMSRVSALSQALAESLCTMGGLVIKKHDNAISRLLRPNFPHDQIILHEKMLVPFLPESICTIPRVNASWLMSRWKGFMNEGQCQFDMNMASWGVPRNSI